MRVVHIHQSDDVRRAGDVVAMTRLHHGLRSRGVESEILCGLEPVTSSHVRRIRRPPWLRPFESLLHGATSRLGLNDIHCLSSFLVRRNAAVRDADIVHIQSIHSGFFSYLALPGLTNAKPVVMTLHDQWTLTGHCAITYGCRKWETGCGECPHPEAHPAVRRDSTRTEWRLKDRAYDESDLTVVTPSAWMAAEAKRGLLARFPVHHVPHGVDPKVYRPRDRDRDRCRADFGIPLDRRVLLFAAADLELPWRGADLLARALAHVPQDVKDRCVLALVGRNGDRIAERFDLPIHDLGFLEDEERKAAAFAAADVMVSPTRADVFGLILLECIACGTPVVATRTGGVPEVVRHEETGLLADPEDAAGMAWAIVRILEDEALRRRLSAQGRAVAEEELSLDRNVEAHLDLYGTLLERRRGTKEEACRTFRT